MKVFELQEKGELTFSTAVYLVNDQPCTAQFYLLLKIHKNHGKSPVHPIMSANECAMEKFHSLWIFFLKPLISQNKELFMETSHSLIEIGKLGQLPKGSLLVTFDT